jgi:hypothetical protein
MNGTSDQEPRFAELQKEYAMVRDAEADAIARNI